MSPESGDRLCKNTLRRSDSLEERAVLRQTNRRSFFLAPNLIMRHHFAKASRCKQVRKYKQLILHLFAAVELAVHISQTLISHVGVNLGGGNVFMA